jgi:hypothetical protein
MADPRFAILGSTIPPMTGRTSVMARVWQMLTKLSPSHLTIVGPRYSGKSVFLSGLEKCSKAATSPYAITILWDLGHLTPSSDEAFMKELSRRLSNELRASDPRRFGAYIDQLVSGCYGDLREVIEALREEDTRVLLLLDGLDRALAADTLSRNLWDQLRELASQPSLRIVTASRQRLRELIRSAATATSNFWGIFDPNPIQIGVMDDADLKEAIAQCRLGEFKPGAETEIRNWSGSFPPLLLALFNEIEAEADGASVSAPIVNSAADRAFVTIQDVLAALWDDCPEATKDVYRDLIESGSRPASGIGWEQRELLLACGFASAQGDKLQRGCRFLERFVAERRADHGSIARLFRTPEGFRENMRSILELRLGQLASLDRELGRAIQKSVEDLPGFPAQALGNIRNIAERSFAIIWNAEFGRRKIPSQTYGYWRQKGANGVERFESLNVPGELRSQCRLLQLLTGAEQQVDRHAKHISRQTYHLLNSVVSYGHYGQHTQGEEVGLGTAIVAILTSLELAARLAEENAPVR